jgi:phosphohistidine phosphatase
MIGMARQLWLLRHADAERLEVDLAGERDDAERRLTERGERQSRLAGVALARLETDFEAVLYSPKRRARETAELAAEAWPQTARDNLRAHAPLAGDFGGAEALDLAAGTGADARLLLVGHEPDLSRVIAELTGGRAELKKGGLAVVRLEGAGGELLVIMRPRELALIADPAVQAVSAPSGW